MILFNSYISGRYNSIQHMVQENGNKKSFFTIMPLASSPVHSSVVTKMKRSMIWRWQIHYLLFMTCPFCFNCTFWRRNDMGVGINTLFDGIGLCWLYILHSTHLPCTLPVDWGYEMGIFIEILYFTCVKLCSGMHQVSCGKLKYYCLHYIL